MTDLPTFLDAVNALGGAGAVAWVAVVCYAVTWLMALLPKPKPRASRVWKVAYAALNLIAGNVRQAKNKTG